MSKILCVDSDLYLTRLLRYALTREGHDVQIANTGDAAVCIARMARPDLVLLDSNLPDVNGLALCSWLHQTLKIPVIMLTSGQTDEDIIRSFEKGADDCIVKPF